MALRLETDLQKDTRGLARWGWVDRMAERIRRAARVFSPDGSIIALPTPSGYSLYTRGEEPVEDAPVPAFFCSMMEGSGVQIQAAAGRVEIGGYTIDLAGGPVYTTSGDGYVCIALPIGYVAAPALHIFIEELSIPSEVVIVGEVKVQLVDEDLLADGGYLVPGSSEGATLYVPLARWEGGELHNFWDGFLGIEVRLFMGYYIFAPL